MELTSYTLAYDVDAGELNNRAVDSRSSRGGKCAIEQVAAKAKIQPLGATKYTY